MISIEAIIDRQLRRWELERNIRATELSTQEIQLRHQPVITISRQRGSGGTLIASKLAIRFNYTLLHRDIIDRIVESTGYKRRLVESLDEHSQSRMETWFAQWWRELRRWFRLCQAFVGELSIQSRNWGVSS